MKFHERYASAWLKICVLNSYMIFNPFYIFIFGKVSQFTLAFIEGIFPELKRHWCPCCRDERSEIEAERGCGMGGREVETDANWKRHPHFYLQYQASNFIHENLSALKKDFG